MTPRDYQRTANDATVAEILAGEKPVLVAPTGSGKSFMGSGIVRQLRRATLWLAHRKELVDQAYEELVGLGVDATMLLPGRPFYGARPVWVSSVQTATRRALEGRELIVIDEAHHGVSRTFRKALAEHREAALAGLTATPFRLDGRPLDIFTKIVVAAHADDLVAAGHLVEPRVYAPPPTSLDGLKVDSRSGDFNAAEATRRLDERQIVGDVVKTWIRHANGYRTILFAQSCEHSRHLTAAFRDAGVAAEHIDGKTPPAERTAALDRFKAGTTTVLSNVELFTEGFNVPGVECVDVVRATASLCLHLQMTGRAMRVSPGKRAPIVLDHVGNFLRHGRVTRRIEYSLEGRPRFAQAGDVGLRTCPGCYRMVLSGRPKCPECGTEFSTSGAGRGLPQEVDGDLQAYSAAELDAVNAAAAAEKPLTDAERKRVDALAELERVRDANGHKLGWLSFQFKMRFGVYPSKRLKDAAGVKSAAEANAPLFSAGRASA